MMKKKLGFVLTCASVVLAAPVHAGRTIVLDQTIDVRKDMFPSNDYAVALGKAPITRIKAYDVIEGTIKFRGGHLQGVDPRRFYVFGWLMSEDNIILEAKSWTMSFLDQNGDAFGSRKITNTYPDGMSISVANSEPSDVYGLQYRINFTSLSNYDFALKPMAVRARYAEGDLFAPAVPEPSSWAMMALGFAGLGLAMRRRRAGMVLATA